MNLDDVEVRLDANGAVIVDEVAAEASRLKQEAVRREMADYREGTKVEDRNWKPSNWRGASVESVTEGGKHVNICRSGSGTIRVIL